MKKLLALALLCLLLLPAVPARAQGDLYVSVDAVDTASFPNVQVDVTVRNQYGVPVADLEQVEFMVTEDGNPQPLALVGRPDRRQNEEFPMSVVVVLDISGSMTGTPLARAKEAAANLLKQLEYGGGRAGVIAFSNTIDLDPGVDPDREHPITGDFAPLYALIDGLKPGGWTPLYDAAYKAVRWAAAEPEGRRAVVLLTDGKERKGDNGKSGSQVANEDSAIREANLANVPVFSIGLKSADLNVSYLERLARETGGTYRLAPDPAQLDSLFQAVAGQLRQQVRLTYRSEVPADGKEHVVQIAARAGGHTGFHQATFAAPNAPPTLVVLIVDVDRIDVSGLPDLVLEVSARDDRGTPVAGLVSGNVTVQEMDSGQSWPISALEVGEGGVLRITCDTGLGLDGKEHTILLQITLPDGLSAFDEASFTSPVPPPLPALTLTVGAVDAAAFPAVRLDLTVLDELGMPVERLAASDLALTEDGVAVAAPGELAATGGGRFSLAYQSALANDGMGHTVQVWVTLPDGRTASDKATITTPPPPLPLWKRPAVVGGVLGGLLLLVLAGLGVGYAKQRELVWLYRCQVCGFDREELGVECPACKSTQEPRRVRGRKPSGSS
jgi:VWFA-related protein